MMNVISNSIRILHELNALSSELFLRERIASVSTRSYLNAIGLASSKGLN